MELRNYTVVFEDGGSDGWGAYVPDLPGCTAGGKSFEEVVAAVQVSIRLWIEHAVASGEVPPQPSTAALSVAVAV